MKLYNQMYVRGIPDKKVIPTMRRMKKLKKVSGLYCITLPVFQDGILEIYEYSELRQGLYEELEKPVIVIGIAGSYPDAEEMVRMIVDEVFQNSGGFDVEDYLGLRR
jgi:hypothetical protein